MLYTKIGSLPFQLYVQVDSSFLYKEPKGWVEGMAVSLTSIPGRSWSWNIILAEGGALYRQLPTHALALKTSSTSWKLDQSGLWNCYSYQFTIIHNPILEGMRLTAKIGNQIYKGNYLWSVTFINDGWSRTPEQDKEFYFIVLDNGRITIQPTNKITFNDSSFVNTTSIPSLKLNENIYSHSEISGEIF